MCGRYIATTVPDEMRQVFATVNDTPNWQPTWNMAPTQDAPVIRLHPATGARHLDLLRWGLLPHWARGDPKKTRQPINARAETVATLPTFRDAFARRRCIVPIDGFYEWQVGAQGKQPHAIARVDGRVMALAGIWEGWRGPDGQAIRTYAVVTTTAADALGHLHERMPVILEEADWAAWLGEAPGDPAALVIVVLRAAAELGGPAAGPLERAALTLHARAAERAERLDRPVDKQRRRAGIGEVAFECCGFAAAGFDRAGDLMGGVDGGIGVDRNRVAMGREVLGDRPADPLRRARNQCCPMTNPQV